MHVGEQINRTFYSCGLKVDYVLMQTSSFFLWTEMNMIQIMEQLGLYRNKVQPASLPPVSVKRAEHYTYNHAKFMLTSVLIA